MGLSREDETRTRPYPATPGNDVGKFASVLTLLLISIDPSTIQLPHSRSASRPIFRNRVIALSDRSRPNRSVSTLMEIIAMKDYLAGAAGSVPGRGVGKLASDKVAIADLR